MTVDLRRVLRETEAERDALKAELQRAYAIGDVSHKDWEQAEADCTALKAERDGLKVALEEACRALIDGYHDRLKLEAQLNVLRAVGEVEP